jgi:glycosyltransferase involved in cell wall biosynthesis
MATAVTVVVPTRNRCAVLHQTVISILAQEGVDVDLVVVDEGSDDGTPELLASLSDRLRFLRHDEPQGGAAARNAGLQLADTPLVAFCDDDDLWAPRKLAAQVEALAASPAAGWSCVGAVTVDRALRVVGHQRLASCDDVLEQLRGNDVIPGGGSAVLAESDLVRRAGAWDTTLTTAHDWDLWLRLAERSPLACVDEPLMAYRFWLGSASFDVEPLEAAFHQLRDRYGHPSDPAARAAADLAFQQYVARMDLKSGRRRKAAARYLRLAVRNDLPRNLLHAGAAALAPAQAEWWRARQELVQVPSGWRAAAEAWLAPLREALRNQTGGPDGT